MVHLCLLLSSQPSPSLARAHQPLQNGTVRESSCSDHVETIAELKAEVQRLEGLREKDASYRTKLTQECQELNQRHQELEESQVSWGRSRLFFPAHSIVASVLKLSEE